MTVSAPPPSKSHYLPLIVGFFGVFMVIALGTVVCVLFTGRRPIVTPTEIPNETPQSVATSSDLTLPTTAPLITGPDSNNPLQLLFVARDPIQGFSNCAIFGFKGQVTTSKGNGVQGVQLVVWEEEVGLLALNSSDANGNYLIEIEGQAAQKQLGIQIYKNDVPVSQPVLVQTDHDCQNGFQLYQIDWDQLVD